MRTRTMAVAWWERGPPGDRKSTRLNSSHSQISYAVFCLKKEDYTPDNRSYSDPAWLALVETPVQNVAFPAASRVGHSGVDGHLSLHGTQTDARGPGGDDGGRSGVRNPGACAR